MLFNEGWEEEVRRVQLERETARRNLLDMANCIEKRGWCQGRAEDEHGRVCLMQALAYVKGPTPLLIKGEPAMDRLKEYLGEDPVPWQDREGRTVGEVTAACRAAAEIR